MGQWRRVLTGSYAGMAAIRPAGAPRGGSRWVVGVADGVSRRPTVSNREGGEWPCRPDERRIEDRMSGVRAVSLTEISSEASIAAS
jgi:hypothetical protein